MAKKKTEETADEVKQEQPKKKTAQKTAKAKDSPQKESAETEKKEEVKEQKQKREPLLVTNAGGLVSHAHWYKSEKDDQLYFTARVDNVPLKSQRISPEDVELIQEKKIKMNELFEKYYPTKVAPRYEDAAFKMPQKINTSEGEMQVVKYNVYREKGVDGPNDHGQWMLYAQVGEKKMSMPATKDDLNNYFDHTRSPKQQIIKSFGDRLGLKEHYEQFKLPEGVNIEEKSIRLQKNKETNEYQLQVRLENGQSLNKTLPYSDTKAFFDHKATKEQLVAKHLGSQLSTMDLSAKNVQKQEVQKSMGI